MKSGEVDSAGKLRTSEIEKRKRRELGKRLIWASERGRAGALVAS